MKKAQTAVLLLLAGGCVTSPRMETQVYESKSVVDSFVREMNNPDPLTRIIEPGQSLVEFLKHFTGRAGVEWGEGTYLAVDTNAYLITIRNTPDNIRHFIRLVSETGVIDLQVEIKRIK